MTPRGTDGLPGPGPRASGQRCSLCALVSGEDEEDQGRAERAVDY